MRVAALLIMLTSFYPLASTMNHKEDSAKKRLFRDLFRDYQKELRPVSNDSTPIDITVQFFFKQVLKVQESDQILTLYCWLELYWRDEFLTWNASDYDDLTIMHIPVDMLWTPDIMVYNNANMNVKENELQTNAIVSSDGSVSLFRAVITDVTCNLDMTYFPFDQQTCALMLASWSYDGSQLMLVQKSDNWTTSLDYYISNMEWSLLAFGFRRNLKYYDCCPAPYPDLSYYFVLKRNPVYYLMTLIVPSAFITVVTIVGFFTPHSSNGENTEKVSLGVTALLSLAIILMMVSDKLPATSKVVPLLGKYYVGLIFIMFAATCATTVTLTLQMKGNAGRPVPKRVRKFIAGRLAKMVLFSEQLPKQFNSRYSEYRSKNWVAKKMTLEAAKQSVAVSALQGDGYLQRGQSPTAVAELQAAERGTRQALVDVARAVEVIRDRLNESSQLENIRRQWQQVTRFCERVLMIVFIVATVVFALVMLHDDQPTVYITKQLMDSVNT